MAVKLRLKRMGAKQQPFYRIVASDSRSPRDGRFIETVGTYDPIKKPAVIKIDEEKALKWLKNGAQPTETVKALFKTQGINKKFAESKVKKSAKKETKKAEPKKEVKAEPKKAPAKKAPAKKTTTKTTTAKKTTKKA